ncbi:AAA family ATPase [Candidatus Poribacteria bacterium]|nr:AAA family ATPase [Candidatus Poribacteria bacterium]
MKRKKLPYGIPNFRSISEEGYVFVDKTPFVEKLESLGERYIFFLRPRKFGKSLFISMLEHYYDMRHSEDFGQLFGDFYIGKHPTSLHNNYLVLMFDFSGIDTTDKDTTYRGFHRKAQIGMERFWGKYPDILMDDEDKEKILSIEEPEGMLVEFLQSVSQRTDKRIYLLIDEYDHFANELLAFQFSMFKELVSRTGFVRKFYEVLKTGARDGVIDRMFITGVTPITLDSLTSGFNIGKNLSLHPNFHDMLGFTEKETYNLVKMICAEHGCDPDESYSQMIEYYNGYKFSGELEDSRLFNPDMMLYYLSEYVARGTPPPNLIDVNIASDYKKVGNLFNLLEIEESRNVMEELMDRNEVLGNLTIQFNLEREFERDELLSLLLYTGFITIERRRGNRYVFRMPNYVIGELYYRYFYELLEKRYSVRVRKTELDDAIETMAYEGKIDKFVSVVEDFLKKVLSNQTFSFPKRKSLIKKKRRGIYSNRNFRGFKEGHLKIHILTLLYLNGLYYIQSELEAERGYVDIFLRETPQFPVDYEWVLELKYVPKGGVREIEQLKCEGIEQLHRYMDKIRPQAHRNLKGTLLIFSGEGECISYNL